MSPQAAAGAGLTIIKDPKQFQPAGDGLTLHSPGYVLLPKFAVGNQVLNDVLFRICEVADACAPATGLIGLDLFPVLGFNVTGVPVDYPKDPDNNQESISNQEEYDDDPEGYFDSEWLDKYQADPESRNKLFEAISCQECRVA